VKSGDELAGRYRLGALLGRGGMGEVWEGTDTKLRRTVAIKVIMGLSVDPILLQRFQREAIIAAGLQHPGIAVVHDAGQHQGHPFMVMEFLRGQDLSAVLATAPAGLPVGEVVSLTIQAAQALSAAHAHGVVHRDVKPANLFLLSGGQLKVCDFGLARLADAASGLTSTGYVFGTPAYMSPEQWRGEQAGALSDLYSLGCVLYALLTGEPPFPAHQRPHALMHQHLDVIPPGPRTLRAAVPPDLDELTQELLAKDAPGRPASADLVVARLQAIQAGLTAQAEGADPGRGTALLNQAAQNEGTRGGTPRPGARSEAPQDVRSKRALHIGLLARIAEVAQSFTSKSDKDNILSDVAVLMVAIAPDRAEQIAHAIADGRSKATCLVEIAETVATTNPEYAERIARSIADTSIRYAAYLMSQALRKVAQATIAADPAHAERIARSIPDGSEKDQALGSVATAMAVVNPDHAIEIARSIADEDTGQRILAQIAAAVVVTNLERGQRLARSLPRARRKAQAQALVASALAASNPDRAALLAKEAEETAGADSGAKLEVVRALAASDPQRAERIARSISGSDDYNDRIFALRYVAEAAVPSDLDRAATIGSALPDGEREYIAEKMALADPARAERMATSVATFYSDARASALARVAQVVAAANPDTAERIARSISKTDERASALARVAQAAAAANPDTAERIAKAITDRGNREAALAVIAPAKAAVSPDLGEGIAWSITQPLLQATAVAGVAEAVAVTSPDLAVALIAHLSETAQLHVAKCKTDPAKAVELARFIEAVAAALPELAEQLTQSNIEFFPQMSDDYKLRWALRSLLAAMKSIIAARS
jgi:hypothetical protein